MLYQACKHDVASKVHIYIKTSQKKKNFVRHLRFFHSPEDRSTRVPFVSIFIMIPIPHGKRVLRMTTPGYNHTLRTKEIMRERCATSDASLMLL